MVGSGETLAEVPSTLMIVVAAKLLSGIIIVGVGVGVIIV